MNDWVYLHEDDWGRIALEPEENRADRERVAHEVRAFSDAHRTPDGMAWTEAMLVPAAAVPLAARGITLTRLREVLGSGARALAGVTSGYGSRADPVAGGYAFALTDEPYSDVLYGSARAEHVLQLHLTSGTPAIAEFLHRLGTAFALILSHLGWEEVVDLADRRAIDRYLADE